MDLRSQQAHEDFIASKKTDILMNTAARFGVILDKKDYTDKFIMENIQILNNLIPSA